jgi:hypothetical protein
MDEEIINSFLILFAKDEETKSFPKCLKFI